MARRRLQIAGAGPRVSLFRIYRDTRFSADKTPLKTHVAAHFPSRRFARGLGAGAYFEIAPTWVWVGGGIYMPTTEELRLIRERIAADHGRLRRATRSKTFTAAFGDLQGERLTRVPRGYAQDHAAADYLRYKQLFAGREFPAEFALGPRFYPELLKTIAAVLPLVRFLNDALLTSDLPPKGGSHRL